MPALYPEIDQCVQQQATTFLSHLNATGRTPSDTILFRDRGSKYAAPFDQTLKYAGIEVRRSPPRSPNLQAFVERWIQSIRVECLDKFIALSETHLNYLNSSTHNRQQSGGHA